ncbi:MAG: HAD-IIB family hydrolase [Treponema sp.]|jgi:HAD superfamily hydrolase (TIGR01484 family)|nr:HAD-IIB family hydrolase [Treponema sp.]
MILFACDLDNTLIHSKPKDGDIPVEYSNEKVITYIPGRTLEIIANLNNRVMLIPATSRSLEQYRRIKIFHERTPAYAIVSGGGIILRDGEIDGEWDLYRKNIIDSAWNEFERLFHLLQNDARVERTKIIDDSFIFAKSASAPSVINDLKRNAVSFNILRHKKKIYVLPQGIDKGVALDEVRRRLRADCVIAAGDSDIDIPLLNRADYALTPSQELALKINAPHILVKPETVDFSVFVMEFAASLAELKKKGDALHRP